MPAIIVDKKLCSRCNTCATICLMKIIRPAKDDRLPHIPQSRQALCMQCGHCEAFCPEQALTLDFRRETKLSYKNKDSKIEAERMSLYLMKRRSIRHFKSKPVDKELILQLLDAVHYAPTGGNSQTVQWKVIYDPDRVQEIAKHTVDWMRSIKDTPHPMSAYVSGIISEWEKGGDPICRKAPHLVYTHLPINPYIDDRTDGTIALSYLDVAAPAFGIGTCWAGFIRMAVDTYKPLQDALELPEGRKVAYAMLFGYPKYKVKAIPRRNPLAVQWV
jgi:nitroreductase/NAD-dependent dihydropyrimidine dehydrogenase PreA subunit